MKLIFVALLLAAPPELKLPSEVKGQPGEFLVVQAKTDAKTVKWLLLDQGPSLLPAELLKDSKSAIVMSLRPGTFRVLAYTAKGDEPSDPVIVTIIVGTPTPPVPPPNPNDPLLQKLQSAYDSDAGQLDLKRRQVTDLIGLYRAMASRTPTASIATLNDLFADLKKAADAMIGPELVSLRKVVSAELLSSLGNMSTLPITPEFRDKAAQTFQRIAVALEGVKA